MKKVLLITTAILSFAICESARAADTGSCGTNCVYNYDPATKTLSYSVADKNNPTPASITASNARFELSGQIENITINEGIQKMSWGDGWYCTEASGATGKLKIPKSLSDIGQHSFCASNFSTIEIDAENAVFATGSFRFNEEANPTIVLSADSTATFASDVLYGVYQGTYQAPASVNIACKGDPEVCKTKLANLLSRTDTENINAGYYKGYDDKGNLIEEWGPNGKTTYLNKYDGAGNIVASYKNGKMIYGKKIYTPAEAAAATHDGNDNTVSITW